MHPHALVQAIFFEAHAYMHAYMDTYMHTYTHGYIHTYMDTYIHALVQAIFFEAHTCMHAYMDTYIHTYIHGYMDTYIHTYIHTCMHALVQAIFFEAHAAERRVICESQLMEAAIGLIAPATLEKIRSELPRYEGRADKGHYVEILTGEHIGERGVVTERPFRVKLSSGVHTHA